MFNFRKKEEVISPSGVYIIEGEELIPLKELPGNGSINSITESLGYNVDDVYSVHPRRSSKIQCMIFEIGIIISNINPKIPIFILSEDKSRTLSYFDLKKELTRVDWGFERRQAEFTIENAGPLKMMSSLNIAELNRSTLEAEIASHLDFKNIPIDGDAFEFVEKLKNEGLDYRSEVDGAYLMDGRFANMNCEIFVLATPKSKVACKVIIYGDEMSDWAPLKSKYLSLKDLYRNKYGTPSSVFEFFTSPHFDGDGRELSALSSGDCCYSVVWIFPEGVISVGISEFASIRIGYEDKLNINIYTMENEENILNDI